MQNTTPSPIRVNLNPDGTGTVHVGDAEITEHVQGLWLNDPQPGKVAAVLTLQLHADVEIEGAARVEVIDQGASFTDAAAFLREVDVRALKREALDKGAGLGKGADTISAVIELLAQRLESTG